MLNYYDGSLKLELVEGGKENLPSQELWQEYFPLSAEAFKKAIQNKNLGPNSYYFPFSQNYENLEPLPLENGSPSVELLDEYLAFSCSASELSTYEHELLQEPLIEPEHKIVEKTPHKAIKHNGHGKIPNEIIQEILARTDITEVIGAKVSLRRAGSNFVCRCPLPGHTEKTPSFTVNTAKQIFKCFGCGKSGDAVQFLIEYDNLSFLEAVNYLADMAGVQIPGRNQKEKINIPVCSKVICESIETKLKKHTSLSEIATQEEKEPIYKILAKAAALYKKQLSKDPEAIKYLQDRGILDETIKQFGIGFAPSGWDFIVKELGTTQYNLDLLVVAGLIVKKENGGYYDRFRNRVIFPIRNIEGQIVGFGGRIITDEEPKYLNSPETVTFNKSGELYGLYEATQNNHTLGFLISVEGYIDKATLHQYGFTNSVATMGTALTEDQVKLMFNKSDNLIFCFDSDNAGREATKRTLSIVAPHMTEGRSIKFLSLPEGEDPDGFLCKNGSEAFKKKLNNAVPLFKFLFDSLSDNLDLNNLDEKAQLITLAKPIIKKLPGGVLREKFYDHLAELSGVSSSTIQGANTGINKTQWKEPEPIIEIGYEPIPFPESSLPLIFREAIDEVVKYYKCPYALAAFSCITNCTLCVQHLYDVARRKDLKSGLSLYLWILALPNERKSTIDKIFKKPIIEYEEYQYKLYKDIEKPKYDTELKAWQAKKSGTASVIKSFQAKILKEDNEEEKKKLRAKLEKFEQELANIEKSPPRKKPEQIVLYDDSTSEKLGSSLSENRRSAGIINSEGGIVFGSYAMKSENIGKTLSLYNMLWSGENIKFDRRTSGSYEVRGSRFTIYIAVQPEVYNKFIKNTQGALEDNGFLGRVLMCFPESTQGERFLLDKEGEFLVNGFGFGKIEKLYEKMRYFIKQECVQDPIEGIACLKELYFDKVGEKMWAKLHDEIESGVSPLGKFSSIRSNAGKAGENVARVAAVFHLFKNGDRSSIIDNECLTMAIEFVTWCLYEVARINSEIISNKELTNLIALDNWIIKYCKKENVNTISIRDIKQFSLYEVQKKMKTKELKKMLRNLAEKNRLIFSFVNKQECIIVNPKLLEQKVKSSLTVIENKAAVLAPENEEEEERVRGVVE